MVKEVAAQAQKKTSLPEETKAAAVQVTLFGPKDPSSMSLEVIDIESIIPPIFYVGILNHPMI